MRHLNKKKQKWATCVSVAIAKSFRSTGGIQKPRKHACTVGNTHEDFEAGCTRPPVYRIERNE